MVKIPETINNNSLFINLIKTSYYEKNWFTYYCSHD